MMKPIIFAVVFRLFTALRQDLPAIHDPPPQEPPVPPSKPSTDFHGSEGVATPEELTRLAALRIKYSQMTEDCIREFQKHVTPGEGHLALQAMCEVSSFLAGNFDAFAAFGGASLEFRSKLLVAWIRAGRTVALSAHRTECSGCRADQVVMDQLSPS